MAHKRHLADRPPSFGASAKIKSSSQGALPDELQAQLQNIGSRVRCNVSFGYTQPLKPISAFAPLLSSVPSSSAPESNARKALWQSAAETLAEVRGSSRVWGRTQSDSVVRELLPYCGGRPLEVEPKSPSDMALDEEVEEESVPASSQAPVTISSASQPHKLKRGRPRRPDDIGAFADPDEDSFSSEPESDYDSLLGATSTPSSSQTSQTSESSVDSNFSVQSKDVPSFHAATSAGMDVDKVSSWRVIKPRPRKFESSRRTLRPTQSMPANSNLGSYLAAGQSGSGFSSFARPPADDEEADACLIGGAEAWKQFDFSQWARRAPE